MDENEGWNFYKNVLGSPRYILAPMVDQSELAWRLLGRKYGAELCFTPMIHASVFVKDARYRKENLLSSPEDRPLILQFCANDPDVFAEACKLAVGHCDAIDLNLGCPQAIAKRGHYGAFLQDEWELLKKMITRAYEVIKIPITCKIRVFNDVQRTIQYAQMLESVGCQLLTVHGRTREQKGPFTGLASWEHIKAVKQNVQIPVFANGNIQNLTDVHRCLEETGVDGVMIAEGSLHNPALFHGINPKVWEISLEYLELAKKYSSPMSYIRGHVFKMCHHCLTRSENRDIRHKIAIANKLEEFIEAVVELKDKYEKEATSFNELDSEKEYNLPYPPWLCQPYVRPPPLLESNKSKEEGITSCSDLATILEKRSLCDNSMSRKKLKKLQKNPDKQFGPKKTLFEKCQVCLNPKGSKCVYNLCKACCRDKSFKEFLDCIGHKFMFKTRNIGHTQGNEKKEKESLETNEIISFSNQENGFLSDCKISL